ncbi:MAG TPA: tetratricopeptide repeat protein [Alphaproteobacteria bacterium]|nr:tetratricopeptide repeat protein [Alphaproteobacteria bacterium]
MSRPRFIGLLLALFTLAVYLPVVHLGFIVYDDGDYVTENPMVRDGVTAAGIKWAFTTFHSANWHPVTWISHMVDCQLFDLNPAGPHFVNALFHAANTILVFALWLVAAPLAMAAPHAIRPARRGANAGENEDDAIWPAAFIAALFAVHPLHVESVAWVSERKDVLSTFFGLLALVCYARYALTGTHPNPRRSPALGRLADLETCATSRRVFYVLALLFFALGLMAKPMLVTWPFVMLLLDYWPLGRFKSSVTGILPFSGGKDPQPTQFTGKIPVPLLIEKIPFFVLTAASCVVTYLAQSHGAVRSLAAVPLVYRLENAPVAVVTYLVKMIWPSKLAVIYPMPHAIPALEWIGSLVLITISTAGVWLARRQYSFLLVGWFWFLGTLVPVLGLVKVGDAAMADRYMYIPSIGIFMAVAVGAKRIFDRMALPKFALPAAAVVILGALTIVTERQLQFWRDDETLFGHAVRVTTNNVDAILNYGVALENQGKPLEAIAQYRLAEQLAPSSWLACGNVADLLYYTGQTNAALEQYRQAVKLKPDSATLHDRLGTVLAGLGDFTEATNEFYQAISLDASDTAPRVHLGTALAKQHDLRGATNEFATAMSLSPGDSLPLVEWAKALLQAGRDAEAMDQLHSALQMDPNDFQTLTFAARVLSSDKHSEIRNGSEALDLAKMADSLTGGTQPLVKDVLGMALAENGQFDAAQKAANDAISLAKATGMKHEIIAAMEERLEFYQKHQAWREWRR